jgi:hypothetical protein
MPTQIHDPIVTELLAMAEIPAGLSSALEKTVFVLLEGLALGFALTGVDIWIARGVSIWLVLLLWIASGFLSYVGFNLPEIKTKMRTLLASGSQSANRFWQLGAIGVVGVLSYVALNQLVFMYHIRADLDTSSVRRGISASQAETIRKVLLDSKSKGPISVVYSTTDEEATKYAGSLADAISGAGWEVQRCALTLSEAGPHPNDDGLFDIRYLASDVGVLIRYGFVRQRLAGETSLRDPASEPALVRAFQNAEIDFRNGDERLDARGIYPLILEVGRRPLAVRQHVRLRERLFHWITIWERL